MAKRRRPRATIRVQFAVDDCTGLPSKAHIRQWARAAFKTSSRHDGEIGVRLVTEDEAQRLNCVYRSKDYATNVLSFGYDLRPVVRGDLVLCAPTVAREAAEQGKSLAAHYAHLIVHGVLHLLGYDHEGSVPLATEMESQEERILARLGFANPYRDEA